jgi:hypothetical protein
VGRGRALLTAVACAAAATVAASGCGGGSEDEAEPGTIRVPGDHSTIQAAVDAADPGDVVLVEPGTYAEAVEVETEGIVIRGLDRNRVILDGESERDNGIVVTADRVAVENLTIRDYNVNGLLFTGAAILDEEGGTLEDPSEVEPLRGYRASYVTAYNNGLYGLYAFAATAGVFEHSYASGHPDSGLYVGQCKPCDALVTDSVAERNAIGFEGTNASQIQLLDSVYADNRIGIAVNSQQLERLGPQEEATIAGNLVAENNERRAPETSGGAYGFGIVIGGGVADRVARNRVADHVNAGIVVNDLDLFVPERNEVRDNVVEGSGVADLVYELDQSDELPAHLNCFAGNEFASSAPEEVERLMPCSSPSDRFLAADPVRYRPAPPGIDYHDVEPPPSQPGMRNPESAPARPPSGDPPPVVDVDAVRVPERR